MNLIESLQSEMNRCRELLKIYEDIGPEGMFGAAMLKADIKKAEETISNGDVVDMLRSYQTLKECE